MLKVTNPNAPGQVIWREIKSSVKAIVGTVAFCLVLNWLSSFFVHSSY